jgi:intracellular multiplication protein IcmL
VKFPMFRKNKITEEDESSHLEEKKVDSERSQLDDKQISCDFSSNNPSAIIIRENKRLSIENIDLRSRAKRNTLSCSILGITLLTFVCIWIFHFPEYRFVSTYDNSSICEVPTSENPDTTDESIEDFAKDTVLNTYSFDYVNYRSKIDDTANRYYNENGRKSLFRSFDESENLTRVIKGRLILKSMAVNVPQIEEVASDKSYWVVQVPIVIEFYSGGNAKPSSSDPYIAIVRIVKENPSKVRKKAIAADQVLLKPGRG